MRKLTLTSLAIALITIIITGLFMNEKLNKSNDEELQIYLSHLETFTWDEEKGKWIQPDIEKVSENTLESIEDIPSVRISDDTVSTDKVSEMSRAIKELREIQELKAEIIEEQECDDLSEEMEELVFTVEDRIGVMPNS